MPVIFVDTSNGAPAGNGPGGHLPLFDLISPGCVTEIRNYHWNNGLGSAPGRVGLFKNGATTFFNTTGFPGSFGVPNANWIARFNPSRVLSPGLYRVEDSNHATWSQNVQSQAFFFSTVWGICLPPATGNSCIRKPLAFSPIFPPAGTPPPPATAPQPCHATTGAPVILDQPNCFGPRGTVLTFSVLKAPPVFPIIGIEFAAGPMSSSTFVPGGVTKPVPPTVAPIPIAAGPFTAGSMFTVPAPAGLCVAPGSNWAWDIFLITTGGVQRGVVDYFVVTGC